jgi:hypothetical protein
VVSGTTTTWTPKYLASAPVSITPTAYTEKLNVPLAQNSTSIYALNVIKLACDANYNYPIAGTVYVTSDSDCTLWRTLDTSSATIGRTLPYTRTTSLVHNPDYTNYNIHVTITTGGNAPDYYARIVYGSKDVDNSQFDNANNAQLRMLYGQCYTLEYIKVLDSSIAQSTRICADDVAFKESVLSTDLGLTFWSAPWGGYHTYSDTTHILTTLIHHTETPYNYTVTVYNGTNAQLFTDPHVAAPDETNSNTYNMTSYLTQAPFKVRIFRDNGNMIYQAWFGGTGGYLQELSDTWLSSTGTFAGWGILMFLPIIFASIFTRNTAGIGGAMLVAFIGVLVFFGVLAIPSGAIWLMTFVAVLGLLAYRVLWS